jgi:hypothetical protein
MKATRILGMVGMAAALAVGSHSAFSQGRPFSTDLTGAAEVGGGDPDGSGSATVTVNPGKGEVTFSITVVDILLPATFAHIHRAEAGVNGPAVVTLAPPDASGQASGTATGVDRELALEIIRNPSAFYVNVHNPDYPGGAVRGQLH